MEIYKRLIAGHKEFRKKYFGKEFEEYREWASKYQKPQVMFISCSDSRVNPAILTNSSLGDIFNVSNVANIVPPYKESCNTHHSTSSAIEFAVKHLKVKHIIVMGHSYCGGVNAMYTMKDKCEETSKGFSFINPWVDIISGVRNIVKERLPDAPLEEQLRLCERRSVLVSIDNLMSFPFIKEAVEAKKLYLHGWYFNIAEASLYEYNRDSDKFETVVKENVEAL
ncbi:MAG: carbonic anhydrase [Proteobacteria bacterium]|nr:carbonic anhydrase [Pseudomonadota bacterium]MDA0967651.1 carbonic anhydrase [Pseudomonadota bacterium]MDG4544504.1 carbonic anhydrase [Rickettsiales bacterium]MDG4548791.1 carbonic anhydrase [Rickettsiales bacterium]